VSARAAVRRRVRSVVVGHSPTPVLAVLRRTKRISRRMRFHVREQVAPTPLTRRNLVDALRAAGLREGDGVFFQVAMSAFGRIEGGPKTVVEALDEVLGPEALIAMPAFPPAAGSVELLERGELFDVSATPSAMGAVTEYFRTQPGVVRSLHPTHSVAARGGGAAELVEGHADAETPFGAGTPFARMVERGMIQVWFGCGVGPFTHYHTFECLKGDAFPLRVFQQRRFEIPCIDADGRRRTVRTLVHDLALVPGRIDSNPEVEARFRALLLESGVLRSTRLGRGEILTARLPDLIAELDRLLARGVTIYTVDAAAAA
jgi:aminoglycoside 3-N-acetyltransferase